MSNPVALVTGAARDIGRSIAEFGIQGDGPHRAARQLLLRQPPVIDWHVPGAPLHTGGSTAEAAKGLVLRLDHSVLAIQGPPGSGKTYTGARMILKLVAAGKKVGVTANSHKVIGKLRAHAELMNAMPVLA